jgi:uncharacterized membrane protein
MLDNKNVEEEAVDRRAETVVTKQPGYAATQQVTRDVAAEQRLRSFKYNRIVLTILGILEILLGLRFILKLIAVNPEAGFSKFIYGFSGLFIAPFDALLGTPTWGDSSLEVTTLIAMAVYALLFWILARVVQIVSDRSTSRTTSSSSSEQTPPTGPSGQ